MRVRTTIREDRDAIRMILEGVQTFRAIEIEIALEIFDAHFEDPEEDYELYTCVEETNRVLGYACIGPTPLAEGTWDIYWIAVRWDTQGRGVGKQLEDFVEDRIRSVGGRLLVAETSSIEAYDRAREFYRKNGFRELAKIPDYYKVGDHMIIYGKYL